MLAAPPDRIRYLYVLIVIIKSMKIMPVTVLTAPNSFHIVVAGGGQPYSRALMLRKILLYSVKC